MAQLSPTQLAWRRRIEAGLRLAAPFLDLMLAAGERLSRAVDRGDELEAPPAAQPMPGQRGRRAVGAGNDR